MTEEPGVQVGDGCAVTGGQADQRGVELPERGEPAGLRATARPGQIFAPGGQCCDVPTQPIWRRRTPLIRERQRLTGERLVVGSQLGLVDALLERRRAEVLRPDDHPRLLDQRGAVDHAVPE